MSFRRGACPALSAPMLTGDGLLVRLATAGASLAPAQLAALCEAANRRGNGLVEITARGNFQIRGLTAGSAAALANDIAALQLGLRDGVPVETNPLAGLDSGETADAAPVVMAIREAIDATDLISRLAPKVSVVIDGGGAIDLAEIAADIRLDAVTATDWLVSIGGDRQTANPLGVVDDEMAAAGAVLAILSAIATQGAHIRARDLAPEKLTAAISERLASSSPHPAASQPPSPRGGEEEDRHLHPVPSPLEERTRAKRAGEGAKPLADGRFAVRVALPFGSIRAAELMEFLNEARQHTAELRFAPRRAALLLCNSRAAALAIRDLADQAGLITSASDPRARIVACPGSEGCASGYIPARRIAAAVAGHLPEKTGSEAELHVSGCAKGCAHPASSPLTLVGAEDGPVLVKNGTARQKGTPFGSGDIALRLAGLMRSMGREAAPAPNEKRPSFARASAGE